MVRKENNESQKEKRMINKRKIAHVQEGIYPQLLPHVPQLAVKKAAP